MATVRVNVRSVADLEVIRSVSERMARCLHAGPGVAEELGEAAVELGWTLLAEGDGVVELWMEGADFHMHGFDEGPRAEESGSAWSRWRAGGLSTSLNGSRPRLEGLAAVSMVMDDVRLSPGTTGGLDVHAVRRDLGMARSRACHRVSLPSTPVESQTLTR